MRLGEVLNKRYQVTCKPGYGSRSSVWLARDLNRWRWQTPRFVAIKISVTGTGLSREGEECELKMLQLINATDIKHQGYPLVRTLLDHFHVSGPAGEHLCLVMEPLRESLRLLKVDSVDDLLPVKLINVTAGMLLAALDYLHSKCHVIHCDIREDDIHFRFLGKALTEILTAQSEQEFMDPLPVKRSLDRTIYLDHNNFGQLANSIGQCILTDFDRSVQPDESNCNYEIQAQGLEPPETLLHIPWSYSADIWSVGVLLCELIEGKPLFGVGDRKNWTETCQAGTLVRMTSCLRPPADEYMERADIDKWEELCTLEPTLKGSEDLAKGLNFDEYFTRIGGDEKTLFIGFIKRMLTWLPEERATAEELLHDPWLHVNRKGYLSA